MRTATLTMKNEEGLHSRPAMEFSRMAGTFTSEVSVEKDGEAFDAKSMLMVLAACICKGDTFVLKVQGEDEDRAADSLIAYIEELK